MNRDITVVVTIDPSAGLADATRTLVSLRAQSLRPLTVIVAFAGDEDPSVIDAVSAWVDRQSSEGFDIRVLPGCFDRVAAARNAALREVSTDYVVFFKLAMSRCRSILRLCGVSCAAVGQIPVCSGMMWRSAMPTDGPRRSRRDLPIRW